MRNEYLDILTKLVNLINLDDPIIKQIKEEDVDFLLQLSATYNGTYDSFFSNSDKVRLKNLWILV